MLEEKAGRRNPLLGGPNVPTTGHNPAPAPPPAPALWESQRFLPRDCARLGISFYPQAHPGVLSSSWQGRRHLHWVSAGACERIAGELKCQGQRAEAWGAEKPGGP